MKRTRLVQEIDDLYRPVTRPPPFPTLSDETLLILFGCIPPPVYTIDSKGRRIVSYQQ